MTWLCTSSLAYMQTQVLIRCFNFTPHTHTHTHSLSLSPLVRVLYERKKAEEKRKTGFPGSGVFPEKKLIELTKLFKLIPNGPSKLPDVVFITCDPGTSSMSFTVTIVNSMTHGKVLVLIPRVLLSRSHPHPFLLLLLRLLSPECHHLFARPQLPVRFFLSGCSPLRWPARASRCGPDLGAAGACQRECLRACSPSAGRRAGWE